MGWFSVPGLLTAELQNVDLDAHGQRSGQNQPHTHTHTPLSVLQCCCFFKLSNAVAWQSQSGPHAAETLSFELLKTRACSQNRGGHQAMSAIRFSATTQTDTL